MTSMGVAAAKIGSDMDEHDAKCELPYTFVFILLT
jgi:hypothetical protein